jgi:uncharacterized membrane protein
MVSGWYGVALMAHLVAVVVWVGGMFFAYMVMRPIVVEQLEGPPRLRFFLQVFSRFFLWVFLCVFLALVSGYAMIAMVGGMREFAVHIHVMQGLGLLMTLLFLYLYLLPFKKMRTCVRGERWPDAVRALGRIRQIIAVNLALGLITVLVGASRGLV